MILVSGFNVYPNEIEDVVMQHPGVQEVAAVGVPSGSSGEAVKIFVVKKDPIAYRRVTGDLLPPSAHGLQSTEAGGVS